MLGARIRSKHKAHAPIKCFESCLRLGASMLVCLLATSPTLLQTFSWLQYNMHFHLKHAADPSLSWAVTDQELVASWISADTVCPKRACYTCSSTQHLAPDRLFKADDPRCTVCNCPGHLARNCPELTSPPKPFAGSGPSVPENPICEIYNKQGQCFFPFVLVSQPSLT